LGERLQEIFDRAAIGIAQMDTGGRYLLVNDPYCEMLGRTRAELLGMSIQDVTHPDNLPAVLDAFIRVIESGASAIIEQRCTRKDGSLIWIGNSVSVGKDSQGSPQYVVALAQDVTARKQNEQKMNQAQADLRLLLDSAADGFYCIDRDGLTTLCNAAFLRMLGFQREEDVIGRDLHEVIHHSRPDGARYPRQECPIYKVAQSGRHVHISNELFFRANGTSFPVEYWARPILSEGEIRGAVCTFVDLTERKQMEAQQQVLNHELAHRVKNTLAIVQSIVSQTLRGAATPRDAIESIDQRLAALANAHAILMRAPLGNAAIMEVIESAVALHRPEPQRIQISGPRIDLGSKAALSITMALHELCTNAAKYGALSSDAGSVRIEWSVTGGAADPSFQLTWKEQGGPHVTPPQRRGFGSRLISEAIGPGLRGRAALAFENDGVRWTLETPLIALKG
jgi:PAS domain S-box-containing protein